MAVPLHKKPVEVFSVRRGLERWATSHWQPLGTLAQQVIWAAEWVAPADAARGHRRREEMVNRRREARTARRLGLHRADWLTLLDRYEWAIARLTGLLFSPEQFRRQQPEWFSDGRRLGLQLDHDEWDWYFEEAQWAGGGRELDVFVASPIGAVALSAVLGVLRGGLTACAQCSLLFVSPRQKWPRRYCNQCVRLRRARPSGPRAERLTWWKRRALRQARDRFRKTGFRRLNLSTPEQQQRHLARAVRALHGIASRDGLPAWLEQWAPQGRRGRPPGR